MSGGGGRVCPVLHLFTWRARRDALFRLVCVLRASQAPAISFGFFPRTFWVWVSGVRHVTIGGGFSVFGIGHEMKVGRGRRGEGSRGRVVSLSVQMARLDGFSCWVGRT